MCQVNNERWRNILGEEEDQIGGGGGEKKRRKKKRESKFVGNRKGKKKNNKAFDFPVFRLSELNSLRTKVGPCNKSYVWVQKSEFFVKL